MKKNLLISIRLTIILLIICSILFPLLIAAVGKLTPGGGKGVTVSLNGKVVGYELVGQKFTQDKYFWGRPSAVDYNGAGSAGSNKGPSNPDYLKTVHDRIDSFLVHNPGVKKEEIPAEMVTASGSGIDPDISPASAYLQVKRIARVRSIPEDKLRALVASQVLTHFGGLGPSTVNVLKLNVAMEQLK
jgi:K+-transporting ATPase ATPase C chain